MPETTGGAGAANDAGVRTNGAADAPPAGDDEAALHKQAKAEKQAEIAAARAAVEKGEAQLKMQREALAEARKGTD